VAIVAMPGGGGYDLIGADGGLFAFGDGWFPANGQFTLPPLVGGATVVGGGVTTSSSGTDGFTEVTNTGDIYNWGGSVWDGNQSLPLGQSVVGFAQAVSNTTTGYWMVTNGGLIYAFNENLNSKVANYFGAPGSPGSPVVGMVASSDNGGYWLVDSVGQVYAENVSYWGNSSLPTPDIGIATGEQPNGGYWVSNWDNQTDAFGTLPWLGNGPPLPPPPTGVLDQTGGSKNPGTDAPEACGSDPVNCGTGDYWETDSDIHTNDPGPGLDLSRTFNSLDTTFSGGIFGAGWSSSYTMSVDYNSSNFTATVIEDDGSTLTFNEVELGVFVAPDGILATLTENSDGSWTFVLRNQDTYQFNSSGQLTSITDQTGLTTTLSYTSSQLTTITDSAGNTITLGYTSGFVTSATAPGGAVTQYGYSPENACILQCEVLSSVTDPAGNITRYSFQRTGGITGGTETLSVTSPAGATTSTTWDLIVGGLARAVQKQTAPNGGVTTWSYSGNNSTSGTTTITNPNGSVTTENFTNGQMSSRTTASGTAIAATSNYQYSPTLLGETQLTNPDNQTSNTSYNSQGDITLSTDALGNTTAYAYTAANLQWCKVAAANYAFGTRCPASEPTTPPSLGAYPYPGVVVDFYNGANQLTASTDALGNTTTYAYTTSGHGVPVGLQYCSVDPVDYQKGVNCPAYGSAHVAGTTSTTFDSLGNVLTSTDADGNATTNTYGIANHPDLPATTTDPDGNKTTYTYNADGQVLSQVVTFASYSATTLDAYTPDGNQYCEVDPPEAAKGVTCPTSPPTSPPTGTPGYKATIYNSDDQVIYTTSPIGGTTQNAYDSEGNEYCTVTSYNYAKGVRCPTSEPTTAPSVGSDPYLGATISTFDADSRIIQVTNPIGGITLTQFDGAGNKTQTTVESNGSTQSPNVVTTYGYNADDEVDQTTVDSGSASAQKTQQFYDPNGNVYCSVSANATASGKYQCPQWQSPWIAFPPNPQSEYSSSPSSTQANNVTLNFYNANGKTVQSTNPDDATTISVFDYDGRPYCTEDATNLTAWLNANDGENYPYNCPYSAPTTPPATGSNPGYSISIFDPNGNVVSSSDADGNTTRNTYDPDGNVLVTINPSGYATTNCYYRQTSSCASGAPSNGGSASMLYSTVLPATSSDPSGEKTTNTYLPGGMTSTSTTPAGTTTTSYDAAGDTLSNTYSGTTSGYSTPANVSYAYFPDGSPETMTDATGTTTYSYDANADLASEALVAKAGSGLSNTTLGMSYYPSGILSAMTYPSYSGHTNPQATYAYDATGQMSSVSDWLGNTVGFTHDADNNETSQLNAVSSTHTSGTSSELFSYDAADQTSATEALWAGFASGIAPLTKTAGGTTPVQTNASSSSVESDFGLTPGSTGPTPPLANPSPANGTDSAGPFASSLLGAVSNGSGQTASPQTACTPTVYAFELDTGYKYGVRNADGKIVQDTEAYADNCGQLGASDEEYGYDDAGRTLWNGVNVLQGSSPNNFAYTPAGSVTGINMNESGDTFTQTSDDDGEITSQTPIAGSGGSSSTFAYNTLGDQTVASAGSSNSTYSYNQNGQMTGTATGANTSAIKYNGAGLEASETSSASSTQLTWDSANPSMPLVVSDANDDFVYGPGTTPVEQINVTASPPSSNPTFLNYGPNDGLSSSFVTNTTGQLTNLSDYDVFGNPRQAASSTGTMFGFDGQYSDITGSNPTGLSNMRARWYEPQTGSFTSVDPDLTITDQPYQFGSDDPVNKEDPTGACVEGDEFCYSQNLIFATAAEVAGGSLSIPKSTALVLLETNGWEGDDAEKTLNSFQGGSVHLVPFSQNQMLYRYTTSSDQIGNKQFFTRTFYISSESAVEQLALPPQNEALYRWAAQSVEGSPWSLSMEGAVSPDNDQPGGGDQVVILNDWDWATWPDGATDIELVSQPIPTCGNAPPVQVA
jgi:RHS repeat-associated protein